VKRKHWSDEEGGMERFRGKKSKDKRRDKTNSLSSKRRTKGGKRKR